MSNPISIEFLVDPAIKEFSEKNLQRISCLLIALRRIRGSWMDFFEDFIEFLKKKVEKQDTDLFIYHKYIKFLEKKLGGNIHERLFDFLAHHGYGDIKLLNIKKDYNELAFINRLPKTNMYFLWICIFYLYQPRLSQKFFWETLEYVLEDEKDLLDNYRTLPLNIQDKVVGYMQDIAKKQSQE